MHDTNSSIRCGLHDGHRGEHMWITGSTPIGSGECQAQPNFAAEHLHSGLAGDLLDRLAACLADVVAASKAEYPIPFHLLDPRAREQFRGAALVAYMLLSPTAVAVADWRAAQLVAAQRYGQDFERLEEPLQRESKFLSGLAITTWLLHLKGYTPAQETRRTIGIIERVRARFAARKAERAQAQSVDHHKATAFANVVPFGRVQ